MGNLQREARARLYEYRLQWANVLALAARVAALKKRAGTWTQWQALARADIRGESRFESWHESGREKNCRWIDNPKRAGLRLAGYVVPRRDRRDTADFNNDSRYLFAYQRADGAGWYIDSDSGDTYTAVVYRLPRGRFAYGYETPDSGTLLCFDSCTSANDAERWACTMAKRAAEDEREYQESHREEDSEGEELAA